MLNREYNNQNIACRFSEYEPIEQYLAIKDKVKYLWVEMNSRGSFVKSIGLGECNGLKFKSINFL